MPLKPRLADVSCSRVVFQPGDRLWIKTTHRLNREEKRKLSKAVEKFAGVPVEVFIFCTLDLEITVEKR